MRRRWRFDSHRELTEVTDGAIDRGGAAVADGSGAATLTEAVEVRSTEVTELTDVKAEAT